MKRLLTGKNPDGSGHFTYTPQGFSASLVQELLDLIAEGPKYPISIMIKDELVYVHTKGELQYFTMGLNVAFGLCSL